MRRLDFPNRAQLHDLGIVLLVSTNRIGRAFRVLACVRERRRGVMIKVKHVLEASEAGDGQRIWVEPIGLCKDLREWCRVDHVLPHLGPPMNAWKVLEEHPDAYDFFRAKYHDALRRSQYRTALQSLALASRTEDFTLLHQSDDGEHNSASALQEFLMELESYCKPE